MIVPEAFAIAAAQCYPGLVELVDPEEWAFFYEARCVPQEEEQVDTAALNGHLVRLQLERELDGEASPETVAKARAALDPQDKAKGVRARSSTPARDLLARNSLPWEKIKPGRVLARAMGLRPL